MHRDCGHPTSTGRQSIFLAASLKMPLSYQGCLASKQASGHHASKGIYFPGIMARQRGRRWIGLCRRPTDLPHSQLIGFAHFFTHFSHLHTHIGICIHINLSPNTYTHRSWWGGKAQRYFFPPFLQGPCWQLWFECCGGRGTPRASYVIVNHQTTSMCVCVCVCVCKSMHTTEHLTVWLNTCVFVL